MFANIDELCSVDRDQGFINLMAGRNGNKTVPSFHVPNVTKASHKKTIWGDTCKYTLDNSVINVLYVRKDLMMAQTSGFI